MVARNIALALVVFGAACGSDNTGPSVRSNPIANPLGLLALGDVIRLNVNAMDPCVNPVYHGVRVMSVGTRAIVLEDTLNPKNGFTTADFDRFAARFDTLVYPTDVDAFGEPTDIDKNGRIAIVFTRVVNELTSPGSASYVGGFAFSRDAFPREDKTRSGVSTCAGSNEGEYFYALAPDPSGSINGNVRSRNFVDSVTTPVLAHELQHIINFTRHLYVNFTPAFEEKWLDEGLAHIAEELLFYREALSAPLRNLDIGALRANNTIRNAYNGDMSGNTNRYRAYLAASSSNSPYLAFDSLATRGAAWNLLRYAADRVNAPDAFAPGNGQSIASSGDVTLTGGAGNTTGEYVATVVNTAGPGAALIGYTLRSSSGIPNAVAIPAFAQAVSVPLESATSELRRDESFEWKLRSRERDILGPMIADAQRRYRTDPPRALGIAPSRAAASGSQMPADNGLWFKLVNSSTVGVANLQAALGSDVAAVLKDWAVSHAIDDVASPGTQYQQRSWNYHNIYPNLGAGGSTYPLIVPTLARDGIANGTVIAGGSAYYRMVVPGSASTTLSLSQLGTVPNSNLQLVVVRTK